MEVDPADISMYGCAAVTTTEQSDVVIVTDLVEKPAVADAPSNLAVIGRYVLRPEMFQLLETTKPGRGGEIQLTDALEAAAKNPAIAGGVRGVVFRGNRYDTGDKLNFIKATIKLGVDREDIGEDLREFLRNFAKTL
jgi:UTP--glucose-1-phosphate uridylyltransferase